MNRRDILKQLALFSGGIMLVPACDFTTDDILQAYNNLNITGTDKKLLAKLCRVIIPADDKVKGAADLAIEDFVLVMVDDCYDSASREDFLEGLKNFNQYSNEQTRQNFGNMSTERAENLVMSILDHPDTEHDSDGQSMEDFNQIKFFIRKTKELTIQGYMTSEYIMTGRMPYQLVPGKFEGKVRIQEGEKVNIYG